MGWDALGRLVCIEVQGMVASLFAFQMSLAVVAFGCSAVLDSL